MLRILPLITAMTFVTSGCGTVSYHVQDQNNKALLTVDIRHLLENNPSILSGGFKNYILRINAYDTNRCKATDYILGVANLMPKRSAEIPAGKPILMHVAYEMDRGGSLSILCDSVIGFVPVNGGKYYLIYTRDRRNDCAFTITQQQNDEMVKSKIITPPKKCYDYNFYKYILIAIFGVMIVWSRLP